MQGDCPLVVVCRSSIGFDSVLESSTVSQRMGSIPGYPGSDASFRRSEFGPIFSLVCEWGFEAAGEVRKTLYFDLTHSEVIVLEYYIQQYGRCKA